MTLATQPTQVFDGFLLPEPLLKPEAWPRARQEPSQTWLLSLDTVLRCGGPLAARVLELSRLGPTQWWVGQIPVDNDPAFEKLKLPEDHIFCCEPEYLSELNRRLKGRDCRATTRPIKMTNHAWIKALFPEAVARFGELKLLSLARKYKDEFGERDPFPFADLSFFTMFLRQFGDGELSDLVAIEWTRVSVFLSTFDETLIVQPGRIKLNPTLEYLRTGGASGMLNIFFRHLQQGLVEKKLNWQEALILDEFLEQSEHSLEDLRQHLAQSEIVAKSRGLESDQVTESALQDLIRIGALAVGSN